MKYLYFVESPLQISSARDFNEINKNGHLIVNLGDPLRTDNYNQILNKIRNEEWDEITYLTPPKNKIVQKLHFIIFILYLGLKYFNIDKTVCIGDFRNIFFTLTTILSNKRFILLDDGAVMVKLQMEIFSKGYGIYEYYKTKNQRVQLALLSLFFLKKYSQYPPHLYTCFSMNKYLYSDQCNFFIEKNKIVKKQNEDIYFFGSKYSESSFFSMEDELDLLSNSYVYLKEKYKDKDIYYIPHRDDSKIKVEKVSGIGYLVKRLDDNCESYFESSPIIPTIICGFYTTALYTLSKLYNFDSVYAFDLRSKINDKKLKEDISFVYLYYFNCQEVEVINI